jgi:hypothetical protein
MLTAINSAFFRFVTPKLLLFLIIDKVKIFDAIQCSIEHNQHQIYILMKINYLMD